MDIALAVVVAVSQLAIAFGTKVPMHPAAIIALALVTAVALLWRRRFPLPVFAITVVAHLASLPAGPLWWLGPASACALYACGRHAPARFAWPAALIGLVVYYGPAVNLGPVILVGAGHLMRLRREMAERDRAELIKEERRRIARELHDVVAHHLTAMNVLVGAARLKPEKSESLLHKAEESGRQAMTEMRQLLHVLRTDGDPVPSYGTSALPGLIERARENGQPVDYRVVGEAAELPPAADHAVYRLVQEALTNTRKHASGATATVHIAYEEGGVEVDVQDDGPGGPPAPRGYGLRGMAERVAACGGVLRAGPQPAGGFRVRARIPT
ncbi:sensor histidine kinase [Herbidospora mongoliensis]|uniref:sensor histidine kinase n=1 Tax=Herbidospora mongoliensis TaxID=688067 RepID=UPI000832F5B7|nr:sensor histidine kinase [Herbidospora mongoliensis]